MPLHSKEHQLVFDSLILIPEGTESIRRFKDEKKWLSSDYKMSIPSNGLNQIQTTEDLIIPAFQISKFPVTNQLFDFISFEFDTKESKRLHPKVNISWYEAIAFCNLISKKMGFQEYYIISDDLDTVECISESNGFRLPTDAEWQYACKAGIGKYQYDLIDNIAWHKGNSGKSLHEVGEKQPNDWGLYDMLGNVWEWCWDLYNQETYSSYRIFRGGSYAEEPRICGATTRRKSHPDFKIEDLGFRLARSV